MAAQFADIAASKLAGANQPAWIALIGHPCAEVLSAASRINRDCEWIC